MGPFAVMHYIEYMPLFEPFQRKVNICTHWLEMFVALIYQNTLFNFMYVPIEHQPRKFQTISIGYV